MHLQNLLKAEKLVDVYGENSSFFKQSKSLYIRFTDVDPDFELRLMIASILNPDLECKICKNKTASVRAIYRTKDIHMIRRSKPSFTMSTWSSNPVTNHFDDIAEEIQRYKWAYICNTECLESFRASIAVLEAAK